MDKVKDVFVVRPTNEEQKEFIITVGKHLATEKRFSSRKQAENYIKTPKWDTMFALWNELKEVEQNESKK